MKNKQELNILLIDDHPLVSKGMRTIIELHFTNAKILVVDNGTKGFELLKKKHFNIVITDLTMPGMGGVEFCKKAIERDPEVKILVVSMHLDEIYIKESIEAGARGYMAKSMENEKEIIEAISEILTGKIYYGKKISKILIRGIFSENQKKLTQKEIEIARLLSDGLVYKQIAGKMNISARTVETYRKNILDKLELDTTADIIKYAIKNGLVSLE